MKIASRIRHFDRIYRPLYGAMIGLLCLIGIIQLLMMTSPFLYGKIIDELSSGADTEKLFQLALMLLGVMAVKSFLELLHGWLHIKKLVFDVDRRIAEVTLERVLGLSIGQVSTQNSGFKQDIIKKGENSLTEMVELLVFEIVPVVMRVTVAIVGMLMLDINLGLITLFSAMALVGSSMMINRRMLPDIKKQNKQGNIISTAYWEIIKHLRLVMVSNHEKRAVTEYSQRNQVFNDENKRLWLRYVTMVWAYREPFGYIGQFAVLVGGISLVVVGDASVGTLVVAMSWSRDAFSAMGSIGSMQRRLVRYAVQVGRYFQLLELPPAVTQAEHPIRPEQFSGRVEFCNVGFKYPVYKRHDIGDEEEEKKSPEKEVGPAIKGVSFTIEAGTTCALVGHSGAGKSTAMTLLLRGYDPDEGHILIDGVDLKLLDLGQWRKAIGVVEQQSVLWDENVRYNLKYGLNGEADQVTDDELHRLAEKTRITEFYPRLGEKPLDAQIGENGVQLSGGQRQRIAIARAIAKSPALLILDEATNALDPLTEREVHAAIDAALEGRTGIIIAHRLSTVRRADKIVVFERGGIAGVGKHDELMQSCPAYRRLVEHELGTLAA